MSDEFLTDDFFLKLIRLGAQDPELQHPSRLILQKLHKLKEEKGDASKTSTKKPFPKKKIK